MQFTRVVKNPVRFYSIGNFEIMLNVYFCIKIQTETTVLAVYLLYKLQIKLFYYFFIK